MQSKSFVEMMFEDKCTPRVLQEFVDEEKYKTHCLFNDSSKASIMIQLFYDGLGVTNSTLYFAQCWCVLLRYKKCCTVV